MLRARIIPVLLVHKGGLWKTTQFGSPRYVGDPINAVRIFNEKEVDELVVLDIDATAKGHEPDYDLIASLASECRMPLCYGGGVRTVAAVEHIVSLGVEKVAIGAALVEVPELLEVAARSVGRQSLVAVVDVQRRDGQPRAVIRNATIDSGVDAIDLAIRAEQAGAGEILLNNVDRDGTMIGYDRELTARLRQAVDIPITSLGGAASLADIQQLIREVGTIGAAAGSLFVFKGSLKAVLITYPNRSRKDELLSTGGG